MPSVFKAVHRSPPAYCLFFKDSHGQSLDLAGLGYFTFHALRHTFASRAMEQGMDSKTLSILLGHYSGSFTLDTYAHVLNDQKWAGMKLMEELLTIDQTVPANLIYPLIITPGTERNGISASCDADRNDCCSNWADGGASAGVRKSLLQTWSRGYFSRYSFFEVDGLWCERAKLRYSDSGGEEELQNSYISERAGNPILNSLIGGREYSLYCIQRNCSR
jgi:hypothetical protein